MEYRKRLNTQIKLWQLRFTNGDLGSFLVKLIVQFFELGQKSKNSIIKGTGSIEEIGKGSGKGYNVNVPLQGGIDDKMFNNLFSK